MTAAKGRPMIHLSEIRAWLDRHPGVRLEVCRPRRDDGITRYAATVTDSRAGRRALVVGYGGSLEDAVDEAIQRADAEGLTP